MQGGGTTIVGREVNQRERSGMAIAKAAGKLQDKASRLATDRTPSAQNISPSREGYVWAGRGSTACLRTARCLTYCTLYKLRISPVVICYWSSYVHFEYIRISSNLSDGAYNY